jgi:hypothetical protein
MGKGIAIAQGSRTIGDKQTAFDAELTAIEAAFLWYQRSHLWAHPHIIIYSDSQSAIARTERGLGQRTAKSIQKILVNLLRRADP